MPTERFLEGTWLHPSRLPLGAGWSGICCSPSRLDKEISTDHLQNFCNMGYATGCSNLPQERLYDSVRFAIAQDRGDIIFLQYSCEKDHRPAAHGKLEYHCAAALWISIHSDSRIQKMAECYLQSYLLRRIQPASAVTNASAYS